MRTIFTIVILTIAIGATAFWSAPARPAPPEVTISQPKDGQSLSWNSQVRYELQVKDAADGDSKYGEINGQQVVMEVRFVPSAKTTRPTTGSPGLAVIRTSTCFSCHGDKTKIAGPSFQDLAKKYQPSPATLKTLATHVINGSHGVWGTTLDMPAHPGLTMEKAMQAARYMIEEGKDANRWVYSGLEGVIHIKEKPAATASGAYILTASYTNKAGVSGRHSITLNIK